VLTVISTQLVYHYLNHNYIQTDVYSIIHYSYSQYAYISYQSVYYQSVYYHVTNIELLLQTYVYLGNLDYKFFNKYTSNVLVSSISIFTIGSQLINYYNYRNGIKPTDLRVFHMICGFISPKSIGINDQILVHRLCNITKLLMKVSSLLVSMIVALGTFYILTAFTMWKNQGYFIIIGIPTYIFTYYGDCKLVVSRSIKVSIIF